MASPIIHKLHDPNGAKVKRLRDAAFREMGKRITTAGTECIREIRRFLDEHLTGTEQTNGARVSVNYQKAWDDLENEVITYEQAEKIFRPNGYRVPTEYLGLFVTNRTKYLYEVDAMQMSAIDQLIARIVNQWVMDGQGLWSPQWYLNNYIFQSWEAGMSDSLQSLQNISPADVVGQELSVEVRALDVEQLLMTPAYKRPMELVAARTFNDMDNLSSQMINDLRFILAQSIADGVSGRDVAKRIQKKLWPEKGGYKFRAERIARTEVNAAYAQAYLEVNDDLNKNVYDKGGFEARIMHLSALTATTRATHAARHGGIYTSDEQAMWWASGSERINCLCSVTSVLVDKKTGKPLQTRLHQKAIDQGEKWFSMNM